jgi:hypothetical protein
MKQSNDHWNELARRARAASMQDEQMPFGFDTAVMRRLAVAGRDNLIDLWLPVIRPALGLAVVTAVVCLALQFRAEKELPENMLADTENLIQLAVLK